MIVQGEVVRCARGTPYLFAFVPTRGIKVIQLIKDMIVHKGRMDRLLLL